MKYSLTIASDDLQELVSLLGGLSSDTTNAAPTQQKAAGKQKPKPPVEDDDLLGGSSDEDETVTLEELQKEVSAKAQGGLRDKVKKLLTKYGATKLSELDEDKYVPFKSELDKIK